MKKKLRIYLPFASNELKRQMAYKGAFYLFIKAPGGDAVAFSNKATEKDLLVVPGDSFGCKEYFRLCYCVSREKIERSLPVFRCLMAEHQLT